MVSGRGQSLIAAPTWREPDRWLLRPIWTPCCYVARHHDTLDSDTATRLHYSRSRRRLELSFGDGADFELSAEFLRVFCPLPRSAATDRGRKHCRPGSLPSVSLPSIRSGTMRCKSLLMTARLGLYSWGICVISPDIRTNTGNGICNSSQRKESHVTRRFRYSTLSPDQKWIKTVAIGSQ